MTNHWSIDFSKISSTNLKKAVSTLSVNIEKIDKIYENESQKKSSLINYVLKYNSNIINCPAEEERALPGNSEFMNSGYYNTMLKRYFFAGSYYCSNRRVLDSCCGLGWGTYIISQYAKDIVAFDMDSDVLSFCRKEWLGKNIVWKLGNALDEDFLSGEEFDVVVAMETIEHFTRSDGENYVKLLSDRLTNNGIIIGTSAFPETRFEADNLCATNQYHLHIYTLHEINELLKKYFKVHKIVNKWMYIAMK